MLPMWELEHLFHVAAVMENFDAEWLTVLLFVQPIGGGRISGCGCDGSGGGSGCSGPTSDGFIEKSSKIGLKTKIWKKFQQNL